MKWQGRQGSANVEDRRGSSRGVRGAGIGVGTLVIAGVIWALGGDPLSFLSSQTQDRPRETERVRPRSAAEDKLANFVSVVLADTETVWRRELRSQAKKSYRDPKLVLFTDRVESACGLQSAAVGPFYCPADQKAYIDLSFYQELDRRFGAPGDFAQAYVLAHEVGHHVQNLTGVSAKNHAARRRLSKEDANKLSVAQELQADCYAGLWAHHTRIPLERGDLEEGLKAASAIGDDTLQKKARGYAVPESFTHGSARERVAAFRRGMKSGLMSDCD